YQKSSYIQSARNSVHSINRPSPNTPPFPYTTLFRSQQLDVHAHRHRRAGRPPQEVSGDVRRAASDVEDARPGRGLEVGADIPAQDRKSTRLNSSHVAISYAVFCLKKKTVSKTCASAP